MHRPKLTTARAIDTGLALALAVLSGCSSAEMSATPPQIVGGAGGSTEMDASTTVPDAMAADPDGRIDDVHGGELCRFGDADAIELPGHAQNTSVSLALRGQRVALAYHEADGRPVLELFTLSAGSGAELDHVELADASASGTRVVGTTSGFAASWWQGSDLYLARVTPDAEIESSIRLLERENASTTGMVAEASSDRVYLAVQDSEGLVLVEATGEVPEPNVSQLLEDEASPESPALFLAGEAPAVAWSSGGALRFSRLEDMGSALVVAEDVSGAFDVSGDSDHVAFAYALRAGDIERVRYRSFDNAGNAILSPQDVQRAPAVLRDASIALFGNGYALTYRSLVSRDFPDNTLRIAFMSVTGLVVYQGDVALTSRAGGQTDIVADGEGALALAWFDSDDVKVHLRRLQCPVALDLCNQ
jgi:hypothetical protein